MLKFIENNFFNKCIYLENILKLILCEYRTTVATAPISLESKGLASPIEIGCKKLKVLEREWLVFERNKSSQFCTLYNI